MKNGSRLKSIRSRTDPDHFNYNNCKHLRRIRRKQVRIMAEARREDLRKQLSEAQFISLSMDERQYQKIVRFRCDAPSTPFFLQRDSWRYDLGQIGSWRFRRGPCIGRSSKHGCLPKQILHATQSKRSAVGDRHRVEGAHKEMCASVRCGWGKQRTASTVTGSPGVVSKCESLVARCSTCFENRGQKPFAFRCGVWGGLDMPV